MARIIDAFTQFFDDNGDPLIDGWLKFYETGTNNTDKDTFADINEKTANANPVPLDGAGRCPNVFGSGSYNVISFADSIITPGTPGVQYQQFDPVSGDAFEGAFAGWNAVTIYSEGAIVTGSDDLYYRSLVGANQNQDPTTSPSQWEEVTLNQIWNTNVTYAAGDPVYGSDGFLYISRTAGNIANNPTTDSTNWRPGANVKFVKGADLTTADVTAGALTVGVDGNYFDFTGTDTITSIVTVGVGTVVKLHFDAIAILTYDATNLVLPGAANITTVAGDEAEFIEYATGDWRCVSYTRASKQLVEATASGTSIDFTSIPPNTSKMIISIQDVLGNGAGNLSVVIGDSGGLETAGYSSVVTQLLNAAAIAVTSSTAGFLVTDYRFSARAVSGNIILSRAKSSTNGWALSSSLRETAELEMYIGAGDKSLSGELDRLSITISAGSYVSGSVSVQYE